MNNIKRNLTLLTDFYELTMGNGFIKSGMKDTIAYFDLFYRKNPDNGGFAITAGLAQVIDYLKQLKFEPFDIEYLKKRDIFDEEFLLYLEGFKFTCDVWAIPEGTPVFPGEPLITIRGPLPEVQLVETMLLTTINHQSLIATKANRVVRAAKGRPVMEFGSRRAHGYDGAVLGARAAYIGGCIGTACTLADREYQVPAIGTMAHSWVQSFDSEYEAFAAYARTYPDTTTLLIDTYNVLKSGIPNSIRVAKEILEPNGHRLRGVRIDSGDIAYLSKEARKLLDAEGMNDCKIVASNSLDEHLITNLLDQGASIDSFGVGECLITSRSCPVFGGVYKEAAIEKEGNIIPKIKLSENEEKITNPGFKKVYRFYEKSSGKALGDLLTLYNEIIDQSKPYILFDPISTWKKTKLENYNVKELQVQIFEKGECVYESPSLKDIREYCISELETLWDEILRFENPHKYYVDLSKDLWKLKYEMINKYKTGDEI